MLVVWVLGLTLASRTGWFPAPWLGFKLALVVALSALHGLQSGTLRRLAAGGSVPSSRLVALWGPLTVRLVVGIAVLAITKPP